MKNEHIFTGQARTTYDHLVKRGSINSVEAFGLYGITRISAVIYRLRHRFGLKIASIPRKGVRGHFVEYVLLN